MTVPPLRQQQSHKTTAQVGGGGSPFWAVIYGRERLNRCFHTLQKRNSTKDKSPEPASTPCIT